jgi:uncharacterized RDD family membrane protein YckC
MVESRLPFLILLMAVVSSSNSSGSKRNGLLSRVASRATGAMVDIVDPERIVEQVDVNALMDRVDVNELLDRVDVNALMDRVDVNALLDRVEVNDLMDRVDVDALLDRVDVNALMNRVDIDALLDRVDVKDLTDRAGIPEIVRESTTSLFGSALDVFRRQAVALDQIIGRATYTLLGRDAKTRPVAPAALAGNVAVAKDGKGQVTGHYAGSATRLSAFILDSLFMWLAFVVIAFGLTFVFDVVLRVEVTQSWRQSVIGIALFLLWAFSYMFTGLALAGRTLGMGVVGIRTVNRQGETVAGRQALIRTLVFPVSLLAFGLGFIGIFISPTRRTLHDAAAGTVVVYDWGDRPAEMSAPLTKWVNKRAAGLDRPTDAADSEIGPAASTPDESADSDDSAR